MDDAVATVRPFAKDLIQKGSMAFLGGLQRLSEGKGKPKQTLEEMDEKMRKKLGPEHKDVADAVGKAERHIRSFAKALEHLDMSHPDEFKQTLVDKEGDLLTPEKKKMIMMDGPLLELTKEAKRKLRMLRKEAKRSLRMNRTPKRVIYPGPPPPPRMYPVPRPRPRERKHHHQHLQ